MERNRETGEASKKSRRRSKSILFTTEAEEGPSHSGRKTRICLSDLMRFNLKKIGAWRSLVARLPWAQEVPGSNPGAPTSVPIRVQDEAKS